MLLRRAVRPALWTVGWTIFQWWAVIGWPETLETTRAMLLLVTVSSILGLMAWYGVRQMPQMWTGRVTGASDSGMTTTLAPYRVRGEAAALSTWASHSSGTVPPAGRAATKELFVVHRDQWDLFRYLREHFRDDPAVAVILDRRTRERRTEGFEVQPDRRRAERRSALPETWGALGYSVVVTPGSDPSHSPAPA